MTPLDRIKAKLEGRAGIKVSEEPGCIEVYPESGNGFAVGFRDSGEGQFMVSCDAWHEDYEDVEQALIVFGVALSSSARLKVVSYGRSPARWTLEVDHEGRWIEESTTALIFFPFWRRKSVAFLQNDILRVGQDLRRKEDQ